MLLNLYMVECSSVTAEVAGEASVAWGQEVEEFECYLTKRNLMGPTC